MVVQLTSALMFQKSEYCSSLQWYNYSLSIQPKTGRDDNLAKLHRNRASCFAQLDQIEKVVSQYGRKLINLN